MSTKHVNREHDEEIIDLMNNIISNGNMIIETVNEGILAKLMEIRGTPIKYTKSHRDIDKDYASWINDSFKRKSTSCKCRSTTISTVQGRDFCNKCNCYI